MNFKQIILFAMLCSGIQNCFAMEQGFPLSQKEKSCVSYCMFCTAAYCYVLCISNTLLGSLRELTESEQEQAINCLTTKKCIKTNFMPTCQTYHRDHKSIGKDCKTHEQNALSSKPGTLYCHQESSNEEAPAFVCSKNPGIIEHRMLPSNRCPKFKKMQ